MSIRSLFRVKKYCLMKFPSNSITKSLAITGLLITTMLINSSSNEARAEKIRTANDPFILRCYELICGKRLKLVKGYVTQELKKQKENIHLLDLKTFLDSNLLLFKEVEADCTTMLKLDPENISARSRRAYARFNLHRYEDGIADLNKLIAALPDDYPSLVNRSEAYRILGNNKQSKQDYDEAMKYTLLVDVSLQRNKKSLLKKLELINSALDDSPRNPIYHLARARCFYRLKKFDNAIYDATYAMMSDRNYVARASYIRGKIHLRKGNSQNAINDFTVVISKKPKIVDWNYFNMCPNDPKSNYLRRKIVRLENVYVERARAYSNENQYDKAVLDANKAIELNPFNLNAYIIRATAFEAQGLIKKAVRDFQSSVELSNKRHDTVTMLNRCFNKLHKISDGKTSLIKTLANSLSDKNEHHEALESLKRINQKEEKNKSFYISKIRSLIALKEYQSALGQANLLVTLDKTDWQSYLLRGEIKQRLKNYEGALEDYTASLSNGGGLLTHRKRATIYLKLGNQSLYKKELELIKNRRKQQTLSN